MQESRKKTAVIIGAGPAGLTAAYELLTRTDITPIVIEKTDRLGGLSCTVNYKGNRIDIGGHRFFSKSQRVLDWWLKVLPLQAVPDQKLLLTYQNSIHWLTIDGQGPNPDATDTVMLIRPRKSRILFLRQLFDYPIRLSISTLKNLGLWRTFKIGTSYIKARVSPISPEQNLEQFLINRFGKELYQTFFKSYTEKIWGVRCEEISAEWGAQRIKGLSISRSIAHALSRLMRLGQKKVETSLIEQFMYPKLGPGQMWEEVTKKVEALGGKIVFDQDVVELTNSDFKVTSVKTKNSKTGVVESFDADIVFSTMPVRELVTALSITEEPVRKIADGLQYRDFMTVGLLVSQLKLQEPDRRTKSISDNWLYIQEPDVLVGRLQLFHNWSPYMVADPDNLWLGLEYFCNEGDEQWNLPDVEMKELAIAELVKIGILEAEHVIDATVIRVQKAYPAYFGTYDQFPQLREYMDKFSNLYLIGRNGMHRYNNQDHSMLAAMVAVDNLQKNVESKGNIWDVNAEQDYHEEN